MSTQTESLSTGHGAPWRAWLIGLALAIVLAAGLGSYLALSHGSARQAPAIVPRPQSPGVVFTPQAPRQVSGTNVPGVPLPPQTKPAEEAGPRTGTSTDHTLDCRLAPPGRPC